MNVEVNLLRAEMKDCTNQVARLSNEFYEFKKVVETVQFELSATCNIVTKLTNKLKD